MPLVRIDAIEGRSQQEVSNLLDAVHRAIVSALQVPARDRYQIYCEHRASNVVVQDTGLGITRSANLVVVTLTSRPHSQDAKSAFYSTLCSELKQACAIESNDVVVSIVTNSDDDWSFGLGRAQFVTGELST